MGLLRQLGLTLVLGLVGCTAEPAESDVDVTVSIALPARNEVAIAWTVVLDSNVPEWEEDVLRKAAQAWQAKAPCATVIEVERGTVARGADDALPGAFRIEVTMGSPPAPGAVGWAKTRPGEGARIILLPNVTEVDRADFPRVAQHELGHAFGLDHGGYVMAEPSIAHARVNDEDAKLYAARWCTP